MNGHIIFHEKVHDMPKHINSFVLEAFLSGEFLAT